MQQCDKIVALLLSTSKSALSGQENLSIYIDGESPLELTTRLLGGCEMFGGPLREHPW